MNLKQAAWFSAVPWATMAISGYLAGAVSDSLINKGYPTTFVRKVMQVIVSAPSCRRCISHIYMFFPSFRFKDQLYA